MPFAIGIERGKYRENIAQLWRSAYQFGASYIFTINSHYNWHPCDTYKTARQIPLFQYKEHVELIVPDGWDIVAVETNGQNIISFKHPKRAIYILGNEDSGLSEEMILRSRYVVSIEAIRRESFNVSIAGVIAMYDRMAKCGKLLKNDNSQ